MTEAPTDRPVDEATAAPTSNQGGPLVILVGAPGSGKSTVAAILAQSLGVPARDTDADVEAAAGRTISEIFLEEGETAFREYERSAVRAAVAEHRGVLSVGGGAILDPANRDLLTGDRTIWLRVSAARAAARVGMNGARPVLFGNVRGTLIKLLEERAAFYTDVSAHVVETDPLTPEQVAQRIRELLPAL